MTTSGKDWVGKSQRVVVGSSQKVVGSSQKVTASSIYGSKPNIDPELERYNDESLQMCSVAHFRMPMAGVLIYHDFVVVVGHTQSRKKLSLIFKAEKIYVPDGRCHLVGRGRIDVDLLKSEPEEKASLEVDMAGCGTIQVSELVTILTNHRNRYSLWRNNCWKYATDIFIALLNRFIQHPETDGQRRKKLKEALASFKAPVLPATYLKRSTMAGIAVGAVAFVFEMVTNVNAVHSASTAVGEAALGCIYWAPNLSIAVVGVLVILSAYTLYKKNHKEGSLRHKYSAIPGMATMATALDKTHAAVESGMDKTAAAVESGMDKTAAALQSGLDKMAKQIARCSPFSRMAQQLSVQSSTVCLDMSAVQQGMQDSLFRSSADALMQNPAMSEILARLNHPDSESHQQGSAFVEVLDIVPDWEGIAEVMESTFGGAAQGHSVEN